MKRQTIKDLKQKGWTDNMISRTRDLIRSKDSHDKSGSSIHMNKILYWSIIFLILIGNLIISLVLVPLLIALDHIALNILIVIIGFSFGLLFNSLVLEIEHIPKKSHIIAGIIIPVSALINISFIVDISNWIVSITPFLNTTNNPLLIGMIYTIAFTSPFFYSIFVSRKIDLAYKNKGYPNSFQKETQDQFKKKY